MAWRVLLVLVCVHGIGIDAAIAGDEFAATFRLRGGFDSNPEFSTGGNRVGGSAFISTTTALAAGTTKDTTTLGIAAEAGTTHYANPDATPALSGKVILRGSFGEESFRIHTTTTIAASDSYNLRSTDLIQSVKAESKLGSVKIFTTLEGGRSSLNQTNAIFQDFLPKPQQYYRGTAIPGVSVFGDTWELGTSVNLSVRRYAEELDDFGYRRDNERIQPFLFARYDDKTLSAFGAVSWLRGIWHDVDFSNVDRVMYESNLTWRPKPLAIELSASRRAGETTFPISPITIDSVYNGKLSWEIDKTTLSGSLGYVTSLYVDSPYRSRIWTYGLGVTHDLTKDLALGLDITHADGRLISGDRASAFIIAASLTQRFSSSSEDKSGNPQPVRTGLGDPVRRLR